MLNTFAYAATDGHLGECLDTHVIEESPPLLIIYNVFGAFEVTQFDVANDVESTLLHIIDKVHKWTTGTRR